MAEETKQLSVVDQKYNSIRSLIGKNMKGIQDALTNTGVTAERLARIVFTSLRQNPKLLNCDKFSIMGAMMQSAQLGLTPNILGESYIIPYGDQATFQLGYKGLIKLAYRSPNVLMIDAQTVCEKDVFSYEYGINKTIKHVPATGDRGNSIFYYSVVKMKGDGGQTIDTFQVMSRADVEKHRQKYSKCANSPAWQNSFDSMAMKTVLIKTLKFVPLTVEIQEAITADNTIKAFDPSNPDALHSKSESDPFETVPKKENVVDVDNILNGSTTKEEPKKEDIGSFATDAQGRLVDTKTGKPI